jgi:hypothetical protein
VALRHSKEYMLFNSIVFGAFTGGLLDYWLARAGVKDPLRIVVSVATGVIVGFLIGFGKVSYF